MNRYEKMMNSFSIPKKLKDGLSFSRAKWLEFLNEQISKVAKKYNTQFELIVPWGFEIFEDDNFLMKNIRRYYCYIGVKAGVVEPIQYLEKEILEVILTELKVTDESFYDQFVAVLLGENVSLLKEKNHECRNNDKALVLVLRHSNNILEDYADYIIGTIWGITNEVGEVNNYRNFLVPRWRLYQLYLMHESIFGYLLPPIPDHLVKLSRSAGLLTDNQVWPFFNRMKSIVAPDPWESYALDQLILPRMLQLQTLLEDMDGDKVIKDVDSFHIPQKLKINMPFEIYDNARKHICESYLNFGFNK